MILLKAAADHIHVQTRLFKNTSKQRSIIDHCGRLFYNVLIYGGCALILSMLYSSSFPEKIYAHLNVFYVAISTGVYGIASLLFFLGPLSEEYEIMHSKKAMFLFYNCPSCTHLFFFYVTKYFWWSLKLLSVVFIPALAVIIKVNIIQNNIYSAFSNSIIFLLFWAAISIFISALFMIFVCVLPRIKLLLSKKFLQLISMLVWFSIISIPFYYIRSAHSLRSARNTRDIKDEQVISFISSIDQKIGTKMKYDPVFIIISTFSCRSISKIILHCIIYIFIVVISLYIGFQTFKFLYYRYPSYINERYRKNETALSSLSFFSQSSLFTALVFREWIYFKRISLKILLIQSIMVFPVFFLHTNSELMFLLTSHPFNILFVMFGAVFFLNVFLQGYDSSKQLGGFNFLKKVPIDGKRYMLFLSCIYSSVISLFIIILNIVSLFLYKRDMYEFSLLLGLSIVVCFFITFSHLNNRHALYSLLIQSINTKKHYAEYADIFSMMILGGINAVYCILIYYRSIALSVLFTLLMIIVNFFCFTYAQKLFQSQQN